MNWLGDRDASILPTTEDEFIVPFEHCFQADGIYIFCVYVVSNG